MAGVAIVRSSSVKLYHQRDVGAQRYARHFELVACDARPRDVAGYFLWFDTSGLSVFCDDERTGVKLKTRDVEKRSNQALILAQACGARARPAVVDLMAGWGVDGLSLAMRGCRVTLIERSPLIWAMLDEFVSRLELPVDVVHADARAWCESTTATVDVVYLDPMFASRSKTALPSKRMQVLRDLAWREEVCVENWIEIAKALAKDRVVVKRRSKDPVSTTPDCQVKGRQVRIDVYRTG